MKIGKPNTKNTEKTLALGGGAVAGAIASNVLVEKAAAKFPSVEKNKKIARGAVAVLGILGYLSVSGSDTAADVTRGAFLGMTVQQGGKLAADAVSNALPESTKDEATRKALGCGCTDNMPAQRYEQLAGRKRLGIPVNGYQPQAEARPAAASMIA